MGLSRGYCDHDTCLLCVRTGHGEKERQNENAALQEAIRRSLSSESGESSARAEGEEGEERDDMSSEDIQAAIERSVSQTQGDQPEPPDPSRPPPYNPHFTVEGSGSDAAVPHSSVGWNRDLLDDPPDTTSRPIGFDALQSEPDSIPTGSVGTGLHHRRNQTEYGPETNTPPPPAAAAADEDDQRSRDDGVSNLSLTRQEMRQARLLRFGGREREREPRPLSELSSHSFSFKK